MPPILETICEDEFLQSIEKDILFYLDNSCKNSVLLFPPVNNYRRFLIHKVCGNIISQSQPRPRSIVSFSIGVDEHRRTVICDQNQLRIDLKKTSQNSNKEDLTWHKVKRDFELKYRSNNNCLQRDMVVETVLQEKSGKNPSSDKFDDLTGSNSITVAEESFLSKETENSGTKRSLNSRHRRPDRAVYVPRAKRSQTTPPASASKEKKFEGVLTSSKFDNSESCEISTNCELLQTESAMTEQEKTMTIESAGGIVNVSLNKVDKDEKELKKASQEINRSNRKLIKQTFSSNVLEIETAGALTEKSETKSEDDDWDQLFDDNGDCLDAKMLEELTMAVGKVNIETPKTNYKIYQANVDLLSLEEYPHVLECSNFPVEFRDQDLTMLFSEYKQSGFEIKWVDDTHCLVVFSSAKIAAEVLTMSHSFIRMKPLKEATIESRTKAKKCANSLQPYKQRPETCTALAKRLVSSALGVRVKATSEEREKERRVLREAKERKILEKKQREDMWNN